MTASAFSLTLTFPSASLEVTAGEPAIGGLHGATRHNFCGRCKSWLFTRPEGMDAYVNVRAMALDSHHWFQPFVEVWTSEKLPWASTGAAHSFETEPSIEEYLQLCEDYAKRGTKPK
jgi:hypothetical protein